MQGKINVILILLFSIIGCKEEGIPLREYYQYQKNEEFSIGKFSTSVYNSQAFGMLLPNMESSQNSDFARGDRLFMQSFSQQYGLGPRFNARACSNCHFKDGRGQPLNMNENIPGVTSRGFLMRLSAHGQKGFATYGGQLQDNGLEGLKGEGTVSVEYEMLDRTYPDGTKYQLRKPIYKLSGNFGSLDGVMMSPRVGTQTIGLGFVASLSEEQMLTNADENDVDKDGISGRANYVWNYKAGVKTVKTIGKYGWKANEPTLKQQIAGALSGDMGMTTSIFPKENCPSPQQDCNDYLVKNNISKTLDIPDDSLQLLTVYQATLAVPTRRNVRDKDVLQGKGLFHDMKCAKCHAIGFVAEKSKIVPQIEGTVFNPYSDFLLHDMGPELADNRPDNLATGLEWRTQPLWGIGMIYTVNKHTFLLHDGRARNIEEAILWHGGEAENSKTEFMNLSKKERKQVLAFINSL